MSINVGYQVIWISVGWDIWRSGYQWDEKSGYGMTGLKEDCMEKKKQLRPVFESLRIWNEAHRLMLEVSDLVKIMPAEEKFNKCTQIGRSSSSVADNIAEGYTSYYYNDKLKGLRIARKEAGETQNHIRAVQSKGYIGAAKADEMISDYEHLIRGINSLCRYFVQKRSIKQ